MSEGVNTRLSSVKEAERDLGRSVWAIRHVIWENHLPQVRQGRRVIVDVIDMDQFIQKHKGGALMGMIYRRKKRDPVTGLLVETGFHWMKYYVEGRPNQESTRTLNRVEAKRLLKEKEGAVASWLFRKPNIERIRFEDLVALMRQD
ncbi:MAG: hypothetical protein ACREJN_17325 [Nitrospiraceae bacterium]